VSDHLAGPATAASVNRFDGDALLAEYADQAGVRGVTRRVDPITGETESFPGVFAFLPTDDPQVVVAVYDDGSAPATLGLYDTARRAPAGPRVDPGIGIDTFGSNGRVAVVACCWDQQHVRSVDLRTGEAVGWSEDTTGQQGPTNMVLVDDEAYVSWLVKGALIQWSIRRRDVRTGEVLATSPAGYQVVAANGGRVVAATTDGRIAELDPGTLQPIGPPFPDTSGPIITLAIDDSGRRLRASGQDDSTRFYDIATRTPLGDPVDTDPRSGSAALRGDGLQAAAGTGSGLVIWDLDPAHWESAACELAGGNLTRDEWNRYLGDLAVYSATCPHYPAG